jgi:hypothetical protein
MHTMYLRRCAKCGALRREPRFLGFVKTEVELVCKVNSLASETRNPREGSIHRPRGLSVLYCPFSDGPPRSGYDARHPKPDTISYWLDSNSEKASWISFDERPDNWTSQFLTGHVEASTLRLFNPVDGDAILKTEAPRVQLPPPSFETLEDSITSRERKLRLHLVSPRHARIIWLQVEKATVLAATVEGREIQVNEADKRNRALSCGLS